MLKCYAKGMEELLVTLRSHRSALVTQQRREPRIAGREGQRHETPPSSITRSRPLPHSRAHRPACVFSEGVIANSQAPDRRRYTALRISLALVLTSHGKALPQIRSNLAAN